MNAFDEHCRLLEKTIVADIEARLPPRAAWAEAWFDATVLHWFGISVDTDQDDRLYTAYSFGKVKNHHQLYRENLSTSTFDYDGLARAPMDDADQEHYFALRETVSPRPPADEDDEPEEANFAGTTLLALAVVAQRLQNTPKLFRMPLAPHFYVTVSNNYETGTWPVRLASLANADFGDWTDDQLDQLLGDSEHKPLARKIRSLVAEGKHGKTTLSEIVAAG